MATIRKMRSKWQVIIRRKNYPTIVRSFIEKGTASKYARDIENQMDKKIFEDMSGAEGTTLKQLIIKYRDEIVPEYKSAKTFYKKHIAILMEQRSKPSQKVIAETLGIAVGKVNKLMKEMGR